MPLDLGSFRAGSCQGLTRRAFVRASLAAPWLAGSAVAAPSAPAEAYGHAKARSVIVLWLWGGPSHLDTFDPKPQAPTQIRGPFGTIGTKTPGLRFSELFPLLAARTDRLSVVRSHKNFDGNHLGAGAIGLTGLPSAAGAAGPNFGAILARDRGGEQSLPPFVSVGPGRLRDAGGYMQGYGGGAWGEGYDPFFVQCAQDGTVSTPGLQLLDQLTPARLADRRGLLRELDTARRTLDSLAGRRWDATFDRAYGLLNSPEGRAALDLSRETERNRGRYGQTSFGQSCLLAARLAVAGVPYIQVNWSQYVEPYFGNQTDYGWDTHTSNFELLADYHGPILDRALSALLDDLGERDLLSSTLVVCLGEFGRTPGINGNMSRDHWPHCYISLWAGGGVAGGRIVGESDPRGERPVSEPITPAMVGTTILELAGIPSARRAELQVLPGGRVIHELL
ncbi:MAG: DUF1501 domain-containing protein [Pirellulales bacterium]